MKTQEFCYWLQGYFEIHGDIGAEGLSKRQVEMIRNHLALVFRHDIDPQAGSPEYREELQEIHDFGKPSGSPGLLPGTRIKC